MHRLEFAASARGETEPDGFRCVLSAHSRPSAAPSTPRKVFAREASRPRRLSRKE